MLVGSGGQRGEQASGQEGLSELCKGLRSLPVGHSIARNGLGGVRVRMGLVRSLLWE